MGVDHGCKRDNLATYVRSRPLCSLRCTPIRWLSLLAARSLKLVYPSPHLFHLYSLRFCRKRRWLVELGQARPFRAPCFHLLQHPILLRNRCYVLHAREYKACRLPTLPLNLLSLELDRAQTSSNLRLRRRLLLVNGQSKA